MPMKATMTNATRITGLNLRPTEHRLRNRSTPSAGPGRSRRHSFSASRMVMRHQFNPGHARRWPGNATLDERLAKTVLHEPGLMLRRIPHLHHYKVTTFVEPRRMGHKSVWPVTLPGGLVDAERCV